MPPTSDLYYSACVRYGEGLTYHFRFSSSQALTAEVQRHHGGRTRSVDTDASASQIVEPRETIGQHCISGPGTMVSGNVLRVVACKLGIVSREAADIAGCIGSADVLHVEARLTHVSSTSYWSV